MISPKEANLMREKILRVIKQGPSRSQEIAQKIRVDRQVVSNQLKRLKLRGVVLHDGDKSYPKWMLASVHANQFDFYPEQDPHLRQTVAAQWRGTWMQGMEAVL